MSLLGFTFDHLAAFAFSPHGSIIYMVRDSEDKGSNGYDSGSAVKAGRELGREWEGAAV